MCLVRTNRGERGGLLLFLTKVFSGGPWAPYSLPSSMSWLDTKGLDPGAPGHKREGAPESPGGKSAG